MSCFIEYERWGKNAAGNEELSRELESIRGNRQEIEERFGSMLEFGTAGMRGVMGAGLNRLNVFTVRHTTQGLANLIAHQGPEEKRRGVAIAYDSRHHSAEFARQAARVLAAADIPVYLFDELRPTPELAFAIRELRCIAGINITASHNPAEYNGYKVYWEDGAQMPPVHADAVLREIRENDIFNDVHVIPLEQAEEKGLLRSIDGELDEKYIGQVLAQSLRREAAAQAGGGLKIVYTPFHGAGYRIVPEVLGRLGFREVFPVKEQMVIDGSFPTVKFPNPEEEESFALARKLAEEQKCDLIIGTDPDADRVGILVRRRDGTFGKLTGNQIGVLLCDYILTSRREQGILPANAAVISTIVSSRMTKEICAKFGVSFLEVLTGFKFIGEKMEEFERTGSRTFVFGFEESYGYLAGTYARDKDSVVGSMLIAEMAAFYKGKGMTLYDALDILYEEYGYFAERTVSVRIEAASPLQRMKELMTGLREDRLQQVGGVAVQVLRDYQSGTRTVLATEEESPTGLPVSDVLAYELAAGCTVLVRPSGTAPKVKLYVMARASAAGELPPLLDRYTEAFKKLLV